MFASKNLYTIRQYFQIFGTTYDRRLLDGLDVIQDQKVRTLIIVQHNIQLIDDKSSKLSNGPRTMPYNWPQQYCPHPAQIVP